LNPLKHQQLNQQLNLLKLNPLKHQQLNQQHLLMRRLAVQAVAKGQEPVAVLDLVVAKAGDL
jgi:hypothetical protein